MNVMRKLLSTMCAVLLTTIISGTTAHAENFSTPVFTDDRYVGDMNNDGVLDASDASAILSVYSDLSIGKENNASKEVADVNHDGVIDASDASKVLGIYSELSVGQKTALEVVSKRLDENDFAINDLVQFNGISWYIHTDKDTNSNNLYVAKNTLNSGDVFYVARNCGNGWYEIYVDSTKTKVYVLIQNLNKSYFNKIGYVVWTGNNIQGATTTSTQPPTTVTTYKTETTSVEATMPTTEVSPKTITTTIAVTTTANPTTTAEDTTVTTTTTTVETTLATTTTTSQTTIQTTTTILTTTEDPYIDDYRHCLQAIKFIGLSWNVRSSPEIAANNVVDYLDYGDIFFINRNFHNGWYSIILKNESEKLYVKLDEVNFVRLENLTAVCCVDNWNMRSSIDQSKDSNIVGKLNQYDMVVILETYSDGWQKIRTRKQEAYVYGKILNLRYKPLEFY